MDVSNPLRSVSPSVDADVLLVLLRTHRWLTGAQVARLAQRSYAQVRAVLRRLVQDGLVDVEQHGRAFSYRCNRDHVVTAAVEAIASAADRVEHLIADAVSTWDPPAHALLVYGSFARRDGGVDSDIDLLLVRRDAIDEDDERWSRQRHELARSTEQWAGNRAQIFELSLSELASAVERGEDLVRSLRQDGRVLIGPPISELVETGGIV